MEGSGVSRPNGRQGTDLVPCPLLSENKGGYNMSIKSQEGHMRQLALLLTSDLGCIFGERESGPNGSKKAFLMWERYSSAPLPRILDCTMLQSVQTAAASRCREHAPFMECGRTEALRCGSSSAYARMGRCFAIGRSEAAGTSKADTIIFSPAAT